MRVTVLSFFVLIAAFSSAMMGQMRFAFGLDVPGFYLHPVNTDKYDTLDSCYLTVTYNYRSRVAERDDSLSREDLMELQMGNAYNAFFSRNLRDLDIVNSKDIKENMSFSFIPQEYTGWDVLINNSDKSMVVTNRLPFSEQVVEYDDTLPVLNFVSTEEIDTVMGYQCKTALCDLGGREWKIFYTEEIPLPYGPWKLNGAGGLILKALDSENNFIFEAAGLTQQTRPIIRYSWNRKHMDKEGWRRFEEDIYKNAGAFVQSTGTRILINDNSEKGFHRLKEDWSEYYNPLEKR